MAADTEAVRRLLLSGARTDIPLPPEVGMSVVLAPAEVYLLLCYYFSAKSSNFQLMSVTESVKVFSFTNILI